MHRDVGRIRATTPLSGWWDGRSPSAPPSPSTGRRFRAIEDEELGDSHQAEQRTHRLRHQPTARVAHKLRTHQANALPTCLDRAATGGQDVPHPVDLGAIRLREHVAVAPTE